MVSGGEREGGRAAASPRVFLGLGSNLGDRAAHLRDALAALREPVQIDAVSAVYQSEPVGYADQPPFWNLVAAGSTTLSPEALLARAHAIEDALGRERPFRNAPRTIDIDLLLYGETRVSAAGIELPHPRMLERAFVLVPLAELAPQLRHPSTGRTIAEHLAALGGGGVRKVAGPERVLAPAARGGASPGRLTREGAAPP